MQKLGTLKFLRRYPVKSMAGEAISAVRVTFTGVVGDRVWAFIRPDKEKDFPWHTAREQHDLLLYRAAFVDPRALDEPYPAAEQLAVRVTAPDGRDFAIDDPALTRHLTEKSGIDVRLRFSEKGMQDARPISIFSLATVRQIAAEAGVPVDERQFRANFYVDWDDPTPFSEDELVGASLKIGETVELNIVKKDPRCVIISLNPDTAALVPAVLRTVAKKHAGCAGVYGAVLREGVVKEGDAIYLIRRGAEK